VLTISDGLNVTLDGSLDEFENLTISAGNGTLNLAGVNITSETTPLILKDTTVIITGTCSFASISDAKDNQNPAKSVLGDAEISGAGSISVKAGINNAAINVADGKTLKIGADMLVIKTELFGGAGGAIYAPDAVVSFTGGTFRGYTNSDNVSVVYAKSIIASGGNIYLQAARSPYVIDGGLSFPSGSTARLYAHGHSANSDADNRDYVGADAVRGFGAAGSERFAAGILPFEDVSVPDEYFTGIVYAYDNKYFTGMSGTVFAPEASMTRAMFVTVLYRMAGEPAISGGVSPFEDLTQDWYKNAVAWAAESGITTGTSVTAFSPNEPVTYEQSAVFLARYAAYKNVGTGTAAEGLIRGVADWAQPQVAWAIEKGILTIGAVWESAIPRAALAAAVTAFLSTV